MAKRQYPHVDQIADDPTKKSIRLLWDRVFAHDSDLTGAKATIADQASIITTLQSQLSDTTKKANEALLSVGQPVAAVAHPPPPSPPQPVDTFNYPDHLPDVLALYATSPPAPTVEGAFKFTQTIAWMFNAEVIDGVPMPQGLLIKTSGDNVYTCGGVDYSASRICYPNGKIFKVLGDVPTGNTPEWLDDGFTDATRYHAATDPAIPC